jgi:hypothetical protein
MSERNKKVFISHSSKDKAIVERLRKTLELHTQDTWVDSRELRGGDPLESEIFSAIQDAGACIVLISPNSFQSRWVSKELGQAL